MIWTLIIAIMGLLMSTGSRSRDQGEMLSQLKRHEIQVLLRAGFRPAEVAKRAQVSDDSVRRIQREDAVEHTDDAVAHAQRRIGRPSKAALLADRVKAWIAEEPELPTQELLRRAKEAGYAGKKTAFYTLVAGLRPPRAAPVVRFEGLPGEFSQHDFGHVDVSFVDGQKKRDLAAPRRGGEEKRQKDKRAQHGRSMTPERTADKWRIEVQASVARCLRTPPYAAKRKDLIFDRSNCLRSQSHRSTVVIGNCTLRTDNGGTSPGQSKPL